MEYETESQKPRNSAISSVTQAKLQNLSEFHLPHLWVGMRIPTGLLSSGALVSADL